MQTIEGISVQLLVKRQYADMVDDGKGGKRESAMKGKSYWICGSALGRFIVEDGSTIHQDIKAGQVWEITLDKSDEGLQYITHTTNEAVVNRAKTKGQLRYYEENFKVQDVAKEDLIA